jgi:hypothetical protein
MNIYAKPCKAFLKAYFLFISKATKKKQSHNSTIYCSSLKNYGKLRLPLAMLIDLITCSIVGTTLLLAGPGRERQKRMKENSR